MKKFCERLVDILRTMRVFPKSGYGEIKIQIRNFSIVNIKTTESINITD